jgi:hypothetical protein
MYFGHDLFDEINGCCKYVLYVHCLRWFDPVFFMQMVRVRLHFWMVWRIVPARKQFAFERLEMITIFQAFDFRVSDSVFCQMCSISPVIVRVPWM